uniref:Uncharacterized protein n=1 Tax=Candidatus Giovannonibacteria bacterium GW2011_GWF2_42_19 TaxID=1618659 RepID=A0A0G0ZJQ9_9BACT|nr:MAG: hypothetical protein UV11_C0001G0076 [Candidatus Giovannonibacteria bacterium GW2011_GWF2_42_19]
MGKYIFELSGQKKKTKRYVRLTGKFRGSSEKVKEVINARKKRFERNHTNVYVSEPLNILDPNLFKAIKAGPIN